MRKRSYLRLMTRPICVHKTVLIFDQQPIRDIRYDTSQLDMSTPDMLELTSTNISRREILYRVAKFWDFEMSIENEGGERDFGSYWTSTSHRRGNGAAAAVYVAFGRALGFSRSDSISSRY